jgi:hypothetical protein
MSRLAFSAAKSYLLPQLSCDDNKHHYNLTTTYIETLPHSKTSTRKHKDHRRNLFGIVEVGGQVTSRIRRSQKSLFHQRLLCHCSTPSRFSFPFFNQGEQSAVKLLSRNIACTILLRQFLGEPCACTIFLLLPNIPITICKNVYQTSFEVCLHWQHSIW